METAVIAGVSHKGGTGRSVTLANLAYHLHYTQRANVCIVDLDLASPTMGAILGVHRLRKGVIGAGEPGNPKSVHDILRREEEPFPAIVNVRTESSAINPVHATKQFCFIPGQNGAGDLGQQQLFLRETLKLFLERVRQLGFDFVLLDIRSGLSDVLEAIQAEADHLVDMVLVHTRWTPQHLDGLESMISADRIKGFGEEKVRIVRTAYISPDKEKDLVQAFAKQIDNSLKEKFESIEFFDSYLSLNKSPFLGTIPMDSKLRWREEVIVRAENTDSLETSDAFEELSAKIVDELRA